MDLVDSQLLHREERRSTSGRTGARRAAKKAIAEVAATEAFVSTSQRRDRSFYHHLIAFSSTLVSARLDFDGDLDRMLVYLVLAMSELSQGSDNRKKGVNALSVAEITLIPRETVRRKLRTLADIGQLRQAEDGLWYIADGAWLNRVTAMLHKFAGANAAADRRSAA